MNSKFDFLLPKEPEKEDFYGYGTVVQVDPLMVHIDGDDDDVTTPANTSLDSLAVGNRVYVTIRVRQLIVLGVVGGTGITTEQASSVLETTAAVQAVIPKKPLPPDNFAATTPEAYTDSSIGYLAKVTFSWSPVTEDTDGNPVEIKAYEIWDGTYGKQLIKSVSPTDFSVTLDGFSIYEVRTFYIRAIAVAATTPSDYAPALGIEVDFREATTPVPPIPSTPILSSNSAWSIDIKWDGTFTNAARPTHDFRGIYIYAATTAFTSTGDTGVSLIGTLTGVEADSITVSRPVGTWYIAFQSFSNAGKKSALSATASAASQSIFETTPQLQDAVDWIDTSGVELDTRLGDIETWQKFYHGNTTDHPLWNTVPGTFAAPVGSIWFQHQTNISGSIIAQYTKTGAGDSDWSVTDITSEVIANLDVGKLTAGTGTMIEATIEKLWTDVVRSRSITTDMLLVGSGLNLIPNGILDQKTATGALSNVGFTSWTADTDAPEGAQGSFLSTTATTKTTDEFFALEPDTDYVLSAYVKGTLTASFYVKAYNNVDTVLTDPEFTYTTPDPDIINRDVTMTASWVKHEWSFTTPAATAKGKIAVTHAAATQRIGALRLQKKMGASLIVDGGIAARHLNVDDIRSSTATIGMVSAQMLDVQAEGSTGKVTILSDGIRLYAPPDNESGSYGDPIISLTSSTSQSLAVYGEVEVRPGVYKDVKVAGMDTEGVVVGNTLAAKDLLTVGGENIVARIRKGPRGVVAASTTFPGSISNVNSEYGLTEVQFTIPADAHNIPRLYRIHAQGVVSYSAKVELNVRYTKGTAPAAPTITSSYMGSRYMPQHSQTGYVYSSFLPTWDWEFKEPAGTIIKLLLTIKSATGTDFGWINTMNPRFVVEDLGEFSGFGGRVSAGGGTLPGGSPVPPPAGSPVTTYVKSWAMTGFQNYAGSGQYNPGGSYPGALYPLQGYYPGVASGNIVKSHMFFNYTDIYNNLQGATINAVELYLLNAHWYANSGGVAVIGMHNYASAQASFGSATAVLEQPMAVGEGKWIGLSGAVGTAFKAGTAKGIALMPSTTSLTYYGYFHTAYGTPTIRITYTK